MQVSTPKVEQSTAKVLIVDDHPTVCEGLAHRINSQPDMSVCGQADCVREALEKIAEHDPNVVVVDIGLKNSNGLELIKLIKAKFKDVRTLVHSMYEESVYASRCLHAGAMGYVNKGDDPDEVIKAIRNILQGRLHLRNGLMLQLIGRTFQQTSIEVDSLESLTDRQLEIFRLIGQGLTTAKIASQLHISCHTVETHRENIKRKLNVESVNELNRMAVLWTSTENG